MAKLKKEQRRAKREEKRRQRRRLQREQRKAKTGHARPWVAPKMKFFKLPQLFNEGVSKERRLEVVREIGVAAEKEFASKYPQLSGWFEKYDALYVLSFCSFYFGST